MADGSRSAKAPSVSFHSGRHRRPLEALDHARRNEGPRCAAREQVGELVCLQFLERLSRPAEGEGAPGPPPSESPIIWDVEINPAALADSVETAEPEQEQQFLENFRQAHMAAKEKRDRVASFLAYCEAMAEMASKEIVRLQKRRDFFTRTVERVEGYVELILRNLGKDPKGKWLKLEGNTSSLSLATIRREI